MKKLMWTLVSGVTLVCGSLAQAAEPTTAAVPECASWAPSSSKDRTCEVKFADGTVCVVTTVLATTGSAVTQSCDFVARKAGPESPKVPKGPANP